MLDVEKLNAGEQTEVVWFCSVSFYQKAGDTWKEVPRENKEEDIGWLV